MTYPEYISQVERGEPPEMCSLPVVWPPSHNWHRVWKFDDDLMTLNTVSDRDIFPNIRCPAYEIELETITSSAEMLDWIFQIAGKTWGSIAISALVFAFHDLFHPQISLCTGGTDSTIADPAAIISENLKSIDFSLVDYNVGWRRMAAGAGFMAKTL